MLNQSNFKKETKPYHSLRTFKGLTLYTKERPKKTITETAKIC